MKRIACLGALCLIGCGSEARVAVPAGEWGGLNVTAEVQAQGATFSFKCGATGAASQPLTLDASSQFDVAGTFDPVVLAGGPRPARYAGSVSGTTMHLVLSVAGEPAGAYDLVAGTAGRFEVCNYQ